MAIVPIWDYTFSRDNMRIIALSRLKAFWEVHQDAKAPSLTWYRLALSADWATSADIKADIGSASILKNGRVVFNLAGNRYRLVVQVNYPYRVVYIRFIGTHEAYDRIDARKI